MTRYNDNRSQQPGQPFGWNPYIPDPKQEAARQAQLEAFIKGMAAAPAAAAPRPKPYPKPNTFNQSDRDTLRSLGIAPE